MDWQYARAKTFLVWLVNTLASKNAYRNVGMIGLVNEPLQDANAVYSMRQQFYPQAYAVRLSPSISYHEYHTNEMRKQAIRAAERALGKTSNNFLHLQVMNQLWGAGNPNEFMTDRTFLAYEDHRYVHPIFLTCYEV